MAISKKNTNSADVSGGWFDGMLESTGELIGGIYDDAVDITKDVASGWFESQKAARESANPEDNRTPEPAQTPNGQPLQQGFSLSNPYVIGGGVGLLLLVVLVLMLKE
ncbi:hypothetical protein [Salinivibrio sp. KP-1]|uniref:hypothetical protein n=1 Tax=Salinivibrio sp. KP-1 TaxID=1406902 RepID=UPI0006147269|nr:hypothetical protein [Salinivibrio sp. KP-1]KKA43750.1 hypothetical protein WN56_15595 [Salinivibrio sp. KP-1]